MRPCAISSSCMVGMLAVTLVLRRLDQNPPSIVTALTGTVFSERGAIWRSRRRRRPSRLRWIQQKRLARHS